MILSGFFSMDAYLPHTKPHFSPKKGTRKALFRKALVSSLPPDFEKPGVFGPVEPSGGGERRQDCGEIRESESTTV